MSSRQYDALAAGAAGRETGDSSYFHFVFLFHVHITP